MPRRDLWQEPKRMDDPVEIIDPESEYFGKRGYKFVSRISDTNVLVYFPVLKHRGHIREFHWKQCKRISKEDMK
jgi:hypothetical protein